MTLAEDFAARNNDVVILSRNPSKVHGLPRGVRAAAWDAQSGAGWASEADGADAIINLAGATIARPPWTASYKRLIRESRVNAGRAVVEAVSAAKKRPRVVVQSSGVAYYGLHADEVITEQTPAGNDFLANVCKDWESSTAAVVTMGVRQIVTRTGLVMSAKGGILPLVALPFRFFVGGPVGSGRQYFPWIHIADEVRAVRFLIEHDYARGAYNLSAPAPVTNAQFGQALGLVLHRPSLMPAPGFALKLALGEMAELTLLGGQRVLPERLQKLGYQFQFSELGAALRDLYQAR
jgi:uncharacterized protein (TIGR01777 family)